MADQLLYRLNRVPEKNYLAFLDLIGIRLFPPTAARADVTFWLSAPQPETVLLRAGTEVGTVRTETEEAVVFATVARPGDRAVRAGPPARPSRRRPRPPTAPTSCATAGTCRASPPRPTPGDAVLFGLDHGGAVTARWCCAWTAGWRASASTRGSRRWRWEAWDGAGWAACEVDRDATGGLNRPGDVVLHVPAGHTASVLGGQRAGWLRCRLVGRGARPAVLLGVPDDPGRVGLHHRRHGRRRCTPRR